MNHETIKKEAAQLKDIVLNGELTIPSFWDCVWPGLAMMAWIIICPFVTFQLYIDISRDELEAVGAGLFVGLIFTFGVFNVRSIYLAVPRNFREKSIFFRVISKKLIAYYVIYLCVVAFASYLATYTNWKIIFYVPPLLIANVFIMVIAATDLGRYRMSAFSSVLELIKSRRQGSE
ncbi:conjugal transfer entry exclusion protein TraS [Serratia ficaria]|nr:MULTISPECIES: hypothetical protein [Serratia]TXE56974.1 hypothetical protein FOT58_19620 [Serratia nematodiphila]CAI2535044.1 conjugal transfer entry exclusion protein TraS [Serratia ficaria]